jgi:hypothetical protein
MDAAEALFEAIRVPRQVVVDHEVGALEVDALAGGIGRDEDEDIGLIDEAGLGLAALFAEEAAVDGDDGFMPAEQLPDALREVVEGVGVLGEDDELPAGAAGIEHLGELKDFAELFPLSVDARLADGLGHGGEIAEAVDLVFELGDGGRGGGEVDERFSFGLGLFLKVGFEVVDIAGAECREVAFEVQLLELGDAALLAGFFEHLLEAAEATTERFVDGGRGGGEAALERGEGESDDGAPAVATGLGGELFGAVHLLGDVAGDSLVEGCFVIGELVIHGVGAALGEEGSPIEIDELLFKHPAHEVGDIDLAGAVAVAAVEAVGIKEGEEELEILLFAAVGGRRHEEVVAGLLAEELAEAVAGGVFDLIGVDAGAHLVGLIDDDEVPIVGGAEQLEVGILLQEVDPADDEVTLGEGVAAGRGLDFGPADELKPEVELFGQLIQPLFAEVSRADDEAAFEVAAEDEFFDEEASHDGLAGARVIGEEEAEGLAAEHGLVDGRELVGEGDDFRGVDGEERVEEVGKPDAVGLCGEAEAGTVTIERPLAAIGDHAELVLIAAEDELFADRAGVAVAIDDADAR